MAAFRDAILAGFVPSEAYKKSYDCSGCSRRVISREANRLLHHPLIREAISQAQVISTPTPVVPLPSPHIFRSREERLQELAYAAFLDPIEVFDELNHIKPIQQMPEHVRRAIASFEIDPVSFVTKIKFVDKLSAIAGYSKLAGDIPKDLSTSEKPAPQFDLSRLTDEELRLHMALRKKAMIE